MDPSEPLALIRGLQAFREQLESQLGQLSALSGPQVRTGRYCEVERGADGELARITVIAPGPGSAISNEVRHLWMELAADAATRAQEGLDLLGIAHRIDVPADVRTIVEERK